MTKEEYLSQVRVLSRRIEYHNERLLRLRRQSRLLPAQPQ